MKRYLRSRDPAIRDEIASHYGRGGGPRARSLFAGLLDHCRECLELDGGELDDVDRDGWHLMTLSTFPPFATFTLREPRAGDPRQWPDGRAYASWDHAIGLLLRRGKCEVCGCYLRLGNRSYCAAHAGTAAAVKLDDERQRRARSDRDCLHLFFAAVVSLGDEDADRMRGRRARRAG